MPLSLVVDHQRAQALDIAAASGFALACPEGLGINDLLQLLTTSKLLQCLHCLLGFGQGFNAVSHHQGEFGHLVDSVATCHHQWRQAAGSQSHCNGMALLGHIHTAVPAAPDLGRVEHSSTPGLVSKSCLSCTVSATTRSTGNTCHRSTSAPRFGRSVIARFWAHCVGLPLVLGHVGVDLTDKVWSQWWLQHIGHRHGTSLLRGVLEVVDGDYRPGSRHGRDSCTLLVLGCFFRPWGEMATISYHCL